MRLTDVERRRIAAVLLVVGIALIVLAATDTGPLFDDPPTEADRVRETVEVFQAAAADGDFETYCTLLTETARERVRANAASLLEEAGGLSCADILSAAADSFAGQRTRITEVSVSGPLARVEATVRQPNTGDVEARTIRLDRDADGDWHVSEPG